MTEIDVRDVRSDDLRILAAVANTGGLTTAAGLLGVDHSTVSRRLRILERTLGARLIIRGVSGWELTDAGRRVVEHARSIQNAVELATRAVAGPPIDSIVGTIRVTAADGFGALFVVPAVARVRAVHPHLRVELVTGARELALRETSFDLGLTVGPPPLTRLFTERLCDYDAGFFASEAYLRRSGDPGTIEELRHHPLVFFIDALQRVRELNLGPELPEAGVGFGSTNIFAQAEAARRGMGVALLPLFIAHTTPELRRIALDVPPQRVRVTLAVRKDAVERPEVMVMRQALHEEVRSRVDELVWPS